MLIVRNTTSFSYPETYIILEKDFSILSKIRGKLAHKITTSIVNDINTVPDLVENIRTPKRIKLGKSVRTGLYKAAKKSGARISPINVGGPVTVSKANMDTAQEIYRRKGNVNWKTTLRNTIQTKDKRTGDIFYD